MAPKKLRVMLLGVMIVIIRVRGAIFCQVVRRRHVDQEEFAITEGNQK